MANFDDLVLPPNTRANQPSAGIAGRIYFVTDESVIERDSGTAWVDYSAAGVGDVVGPASAVDNQFALFNSTTGKLIKAGGLYAQSVYTPTFTNTTNIAASTPFVCQYIRVGNVVTVSGRCAIDVTSAATFTMGVSIPIASNFANTTECCGAAISGERDTAEIYADTTNDRATINGLAVTTSNIGYSFIFQYLVI